VSERLAVPEARDRDVKGRQPAKRLGGLGAVDVEHAADDPPVLAAGDGVAGEQHLVPGQVHRDAPRRVAGSGHRDRAVAEAKPVAVGELPVDPRRNQRRHRPRRELARDSLVDGPFPVGQVRGRPDAGGADERRVGLVREHRHLALALLGDVRRGADVVEMKVREHHLAQVRGLVPGLADRVVKQRRGAGQPGVDERQPVRVGPQVGVPDRKADEVQARQQLDNIHAPTVSARRRAHLAVLSWAAGRPSFMPVNPAHRGADRDSTTENSFIVENNYSYGVKILRTEKSFHDNRRAAGEFHPGSTGS